VSGFVASFGQLAAHSDWEVEGFHLQALQKVVGLPLLPLAGA